MNNKLTLSLKTDWQNPFSEFSSIDWSDAISKSNTNMKIAIFWILYLKNCWVDSRIWRYHKFWECNCVKSNSISLNNVSKPNCFGNFSILIWQCISCNWNAKLSEDLNICLQLKETHVSFRISLNARLFIAFDHVLGIVVDLSGNKNTCTKSVFGRRSLSMFSDLEFLKYFHFLMSHFLSSRFLSIHEVLCLIVCSWSVYHWMIVWSLSASQPKIMCTSLVKWSLCAPVVAWRFVSDPCSENGNFQIRCPSLKLMNDK